MRQWKDLFKVRAEKIIFGVSLGWQISKTLSLKSTYLKVADEAYIHQSF